MTVTQQSKELNTRLESYLEHLKILEYRADDRTYPWIAKKLGYKHASSIQNHSIKWKWLDEYIADLIHQEVTKARIEELEKLMESAAWLANDPFVSVRNAIDKRIEELEPPQHPNEEKK